MIRRYRSKQPSPKRLTKMKLLLVFGLFALIFLFPGSVYGTLLSIALALSPRICELTLVGITSWAILKH